MIKAEWTNADALDLQPTCNQLATDTISRQATQTNTPNALEALDCISRQAVKEWLAKWEGYIDTDIIARMQYRVIDIPSAQPVTPCYLGSPCEYQNTDAKLPSTQPERLTDDDFETIRIHLNAYKENLCNQQRWKEAEEYQRIIDRFMAFATAQPKPQWTPCRERLPEESGRYLISVLDGVGRRTTVAPYQPRYKAWTMTGRMAYWKVIAWMPLPEPYEEGAK